MSGARRTSAGWVLLTLLVLPLGAASDSWRAVIVGDDEPGDRLRLSGVVYGPDGVTPVAGATVHIHNTNARGVYRRDGSGEGRIEGNVVTDERGRYEFLTVKPSSYPNTRNPAHIHMQVRDEAGRRGGATLRFMEDPLISDESKRRAREEGRFARIRPLQQDADGVWLCSFDVKLE